MADRQRAFQAAGRQLAMDFGVAPQAVWTGGLRFVPPALPPGRRVYSQEPPFFELLVTGASGILMAEEALWPRLKAWAGDAGEPHWLLEFPRLLELSPILEPYDYTLTQTFHHFLPSRDFSPAAAPKGLTLKLLEREDIAAYYPNEAWPNALHSQENPLRPDVLALAAMDGETVAALAGASADGQELWQVGIDVRPEYRGQGLGTLLVEGLCYEVERRGALPFYGTSLSNIHSQNIAWNCGFRPAWTGVSAKKKHGRQAL